MVEFENNMELYTGTTKPINTPTPSRVIKTESLGYDVTGLFISITILTIASFIVAVKLVSKNTYNIENDEDIKLVKKTNRSLTLI